MKLYKASEKEWIRGKGYAKRPLITSSELGIEGSFIQEVSFNRGDIVPLHHHAQQTEVFYAIDEAWFEINGKNVVMQPGDIVMCEPGDVHGNPEIPHDFKILVLKIGYKENDTFWD
ncbi:MAG: Cupin domain protein [Methanomassiliicoccales archaeon PtaU1.Bin124]|nr:MAG: Cupin domain protein [Methanomassiliicoccales archaeon PtaU1.Bin124]